MMNVVPRDGLFRRTLNLIQATAGRAMAPLSIIDAGTYAILVQGWLDESWSDSLGGMRIRGSGTGRHASTILVGRIADQAALISILNTLYDLGFPILSVEYISTPG